jgi:hypothetical protein
MEMIAVNQTKNNLSSGWWADEKQVLLEAIKANCRLLAPHPVIYPESR